MSRLKADPKPKPSTAPNVNPDLLARAFLQMLAKQEGARMKPLLHGSDDRDDPIGRMLDDLEDPHGNENGVSLRPDLAAVAILIARAIEAEKGLARRLRRDSPVVVLATHTPDLVELAKDVITSCALPTDFRIAEDGLGLRQPLPRPTAVVLARDGTGKSDRPDKGNEGIASALHRRLPVIGIAPDPGRHLPRALMRTAETQLSLPVLDESALALVIEVVAGEKPSRHLDAELVRLVDVEDLPLALRSGRSADECIDALDEIVRKKGDYLGSGPSLEELDGYGEAKVWGLELAADLADYKAGRLTWDQVDHKGLLISGPPGVGKTTFARALAKTARVPIVATSVAEWNAATYLSGTLQAIREAFAQARRQAPCVLFIDELDGISDRTRLRGEHVEYWTQIVNLTLELLSSVDERPGVIVLGASNYSDKIDPAIKRAGRLDREIVIEKPDVATLARIFRHHVGSDISADVDLMPLALASRGVTGADVEAIVRRARGAARRAKRALLLDDILAQVTAKQPSMTPDVRRRVAVHEAGHAIVARALGTCVLLAISIHDRGGTLAFEGGLDGAATLVRLNDEMAVLLAGRAAERLVLGNISVGAGIIRQSDLGYATSIARSIELRFGLGRFGSVFIEEADDFASIPGLLLAVRDHLDRAEARAGEILSDQMPALTALSEALERSGYLAGEEADAIIGSHGGFSRTAHAAKPTNGMLAIGRTS